MLPEPRRTEIDHRTIKLLVGVIALSIAPTTSLFAHTRIASISASYYEPGWSQSVFIGFLFAIGALLLAYNGRTRTEMAMSKVAAVAGLGVALFPCKCVTHPELLPHAHGMFAAVMFLVLAYFCYEFWSRAKDKHTTEARRRAFIYTLCGAAIIASIVVLLLIGVSGKVAGAFGPRGTFYGEMLGLVAFGISWLTASRVLPLLSSTGERFSPLRAQNPAD